MTAPGFFPESRVTPDPGFSPGASVVCWKVEQTEYECRSGKSEGGVVPGGFLFLCRVLNLKPTGFLVFKPHDG